MHKRFLESCSDETKNNVPDPVLVDRAVLGQWAAVSWTQAFDASEGIFPVIDGVCGQFDDFVQQAIWFLIDGFHQADRIDKIRCCHFSSVCLHHLISSSVPFTNRILQLPKTWNPLPPVAIYNTSGIPESHIQDGSGFICWLVLLQADCLAFHIFFKMPGGCAGWFDDYISGCG